MPRVLLVDDDSASQDALRQLFEDRNDFDVCGHPETGEKAVQAAKRHLPRLIVLGLALRHDRLAELVGKLREASPGAHILLLTRQNNSAIEKQALAAGISAVFSKFDDYEGLILNAEALFDQT